MEIMIRSFEERDIPEVMRLLDAGRPYTLAHHGYSYWMLASYLSDLCFVAEAEGEIIGYAGCLASPGKKCTFVWQVAVAEKSRGKGIGRQLLDRVAAGTKAAGYHSIQCSISKENTASNAMFASLAERLGTELVRLGAYSDESFAEDVLEIKL